MYTLFGVILLIALTQADQFSPTVAGWSLAGCHSDFYPNGRTLNGGYYMDSSMTIAKCLNFCDGQSQYFAGIENGNQCFCGPYFEGGTFTVGSGISASNNGGCNVACPGASGQNCGGGNRQLTFVTTKRSAAKAATVSGYNNLGCFPDSTSNRLLPVFAQGSDASNTPAKCASECTSMGYDLSGVEYSQECHCGSSSKVTLPATTNGCAYTCTGDRTLLCGGASRIQIYQKASGVGGGGGASNDPQYVYYSSTRYTNKGCYKDRTDSQGRALTGSYTCTNQNTVDACVNICGANGYKYFGVEYGCECRCGNTLNYNSTSGAVCDMACPGNPNQICGGSNYAMVLYQRG